MNYFDIAKFNSIIWFSHDQKKFKEVENAAKNLFQLLGYNKNVDKSARLVAKAYYFYDKGWDIFPNKNSLIFFEKGLKTHLKIRRLLGEATLSGKFHHLWWMDFGRKNYVFTFFWAFLFHISKFKSFNIFKSFRATILLAKSGLKGHNERDIQLARKLLVNYWKYVLSNNMREKLIY